ncbi:hypothetical protein BKE38_19050 [Pseudoroseomonas deserti]|uniref:Uncharacterized protein n=1 Tax=Teichococcus deserti TaxID=1817963 RepID=A0A1V2H105_9PROT|nr:hypothetical protein [Pseudoroseomonas deserti]ONG50180.1 hypothetical protein BKE38_19050 [Pseudoroseomonas deserti]
MAQEMKELVVATAGRWSGVQPPNEAALELAADLQSIVAAFEAVRGGLRFEDEPAGFEAALQACKETP